MYPFDLTVCFLGRSVMHFVSAPNTSISLLLVLKTSAYFSSIQCRLLLLLLLLPLARNGIFTVISPLRGLPKFSLPFTNILNISLAVYVDSLE